MGKSILDLKNELGEFKGNQVNALATSLQKKDEKVKELKKEVNSALKQLSLMEWWVMFNVTNNGKVVLKGLEKLSINSEKLFLWWDI